MKNRPILMTVREVSGILRIQRAKVYILIENGTLQAFKVGSDWRVRTDSVEKLSGGFPEEYFSGQPVEEISEVAA